MSLEPLGLRERKKLRTRELIVRVAYDLFAERGFDGATVADIADAADISPRTFFGYFPSKDDVVFHDHDELLASVGERLRGRSADEDPFDALRAWVLELEATGQLKQPEERARRLLVDATPALAARERSNLSEFERLIAEAVAEDLGVDPDSLRPHLVAAAAVAALESLGRLRDDEAAEPEPGGGSAADVLDEALVFLRGGLDALRRRPPGG